MKIFISHSSEDLKMVRKFVELLYHIGIRETDIFCSSVPELSIPEGENICDYLASMFQKEELYVIFMLSNSYYDSAICLNEMGAAWVTKTEYTTVLFPSFEYNMIQGAIDPRKISIKLDSESARKQLNELKTKLQNKLGISVDSISYERWERYRNKFIHQACEEYQQISRINLQHCRSYCIGDQSADGCIINDSTLSEDHLSAEIDFSKTSQSLSSIVIFPQKNNWRFEVKNNKCLHFDAIATNPLTITLEIKHKDTAYHARRTFDVHRSSRTYLMNLKEYGDLDKWENVTEICFLIERKCCPHPTDLTIEKLSLK